MGTAVPKIGCGAAPGHPRARAGFPQGAPLLFEEVSLWEDIPDIRYRPQPYFLTRFKQDPRCAGC